MSVHVMADGLIAQNAIMEEMAKALVIVKIVMERENRNKFDYPKFTISNFTFDLFLIKY